MNEQDSLLIERLNQHPKLRHRMNALLDVVDNAAGDCTKADEAEQYVITELQKMGNDALTSWADKAVLGSTERASQAHSGLCKEGEKKSTGTAPLEK